MKFKALSVFGVKYGLNAKIGSSLQVQEISNELENQLLIYSDGFQK
jgi:hypothetical protein